MDDVQEMLRQIVNTQKAFRNEVLEEVREIKNEIVGVNGEMVVLKGEVAGIKEEMVVLKGEVAGIKEEMVVLKGEVAGIKEEIVILRGEVAQVEARLTKRIDMAFRELADLSDDAPTREEFDELSTRVGVLEQASSAN